MPEDKDFKRIVRARMTDTGERYTTARAVLRPDGAGGRPAPLAGLVPMDRGALEAWRGQRPRPVPGPQPPESSFGPDWELTVDAGGPASTLHPAVLDLARAAALGAELRGVPYVSFGLDLRMPAPEGSSADDGRPPSSAVHRASLEPLQHAQAELHHRIGEYLGIELTGVTHFTTGRVREEDGELVVPGRSGTTVLVDQAGATDVLDPWTWWALPGEPLGKPWVAYGVVLHLQRDFPTRRFPTHPPADFTGPYHVGAIIDEAYWAEVGETLTAAAAAVGLPAWPLHQAKLNNASTRSGQGKNWQLPV